MQLSYSSLREFSEQESNLLETNGWISLSKSGLDTIPLILAVFFRWEKTADVVALVRLLKFKSESNISQKFLT